ncbi:hypothetical protein M9H77_13922 [Catharanthus roseus]|uniref:Uncharacterized protein n=1 Tax=Catharanthus roseus TaxID=4058 RepID=A0ACC0BLT8_CATRO|nr:hypothetical protein M9H77_13922 [Catharanthus roseus]
MSKETKLTSMALQHDKATQENTKKPHGRPKGLKNNNQKPIENKQRLPKHIRRPKGKLTTYWKPKCEVFSITISASDLKDTHICLSDGNVDAQNQKDCKEFYDQLGEEEKKNEETVKNTRTNMTSKMISNTATAERTFVLNLRILTWNSFAEILRCVSWYQSLNSIHTNDVRWKRRTTTKRSAYSGGVTNVPVAANVQNRVAGYNSDDEEDLILAEDQNRPTRRGGGRRFYDQLGEEEKKNEETVKNKGSNMTSNMISNTVTTEHLSRGFRIEIPMIDYISHWLTKMVISIPFMMLQDIDWAWHWPSIDPLVQLGPQAMEKPIYADL